MGKKIIGFIGWLLIGFIILKDLTFDAPYKGNNYLIFMWFSLAQSCANIFLWMGVFLVAKSKQPDLPNEEKGWSLLTGAIIGAVCGFLLAVLSVWIFPFRGDMGIGSLVYAIVLTTIGIGLGMMAGDNWKSKK